jgi:hypothetical protein
MGHRICVSAVAFAAFVSMASDCESSSPPDGDRCRTGCPCGAACIDCDDTCHMDEGLTAEVDAGAAKR